jgi:serine/threonine protein kinase
MTASPPDNAAIFHAARDIPDPKRRREYVREACGGDEARIAHVEALLAAAEGPDSLLDRPAAGTHAATIDQPTTESSGAVIGPYKLLEKIGEGGMGTVWMAQQTEPVRRLVAVKLIKAGMDSRQVIARFEAERQALALMDHPNIARVLDAGTTGAGRPYFIMDLVKGLSITRYCDEHHFTPRQRLELFIPVCQAIQHAHQKGIIHRDLKPSNVLVAPYDGKPVVKVIDFGVAKAAGQPLTDRTLVTGFGAVVGTLEYMSPEQAELNNHDIDTRSDIYALGVLLYELLAGSPPFSRMELEKAGMVEMLRVIREQEPSKPSTKLSTAEGFPTLAANRGMEPAKLTALVRGELDWIVMKALEKDRTRRYETANAFAMDVQRYLAGEPVLAAPASQWYRLRKFAGKHHTALATAAAFVMMLVAGAVLSTWLAIRAMQAETAANVNADQARLNAEDSDRNAQRARSEANAKDAALRAEQQARADESKARERAFDALHSMTADVIERKFTQGTVLTEGDRAFLRGIIAQYDAFAAIKGDDADSRAIRAEGRFRVGNMRRTLGELKEAQQDYDQALSFYKQLADDFPKRPEFRLGLARSHFNRGILRRGMGRLPEAQQDYDQALSLYKQLADDSPDRPKYREELASSHHNRGLLLSVRGRPKEAEKDYNQALSLYKHLVDECPTQPRFRQEPAMIHNNRGYLRWEMGRLKEAEQDFDQTLSIQKQLAADFRSRPEFRRDLAISYNNRGNLLRGKRRLAEAAKYYDQALNIRRQLAADFPYRPEYREELGRSHFNRGELLLLMNRPKDAENDYNLAVSLFRPLAGDFPNRPEFRQELAQTLTSRGVLMATLYSLKEAERDYDQALDILKKLVADFPKQPDLHNHLAGTCCNLAIFHSRQENLAAAKRLFLVARPHHLAALEAKPSHPLYRQYYVKHLAVLTQVHAALLEQEDAVRTAETRRDVGWTAPGDAYAAACLLSACVPLVARHDKLDDQQRKEAVRFYADAAMRLLHEAVSKGFKDVAYMKRDNNLYPLRPREDFQKLVADLEWNRK